MLKTIIRKEVLETIFSYRFPLFALICVLLIPLGLYVNEMDYSKRVRDYSEQVRLADEAVKNIGIQDVIAGTAVIRGFRPPAPMSVFTEGFESTLPRYYEFNQDGVKPGESGSENASILSAQGRVDFVFLIQMIVSLVALLFASDMISGEKEAGTLRAMLTNSLPRDSLLAGKIGGGCLSLLVPFSVAFVIGLVILSFSSVSLFGGDSAVRILLIYLATAGFILSFFTIGMAVSAATSRARTSVVTILIVWAAFQLIIPKLGDMGARLIYPVRTDTEVSLQKSLLVKSLDMDTAKELGREYDRIFAALPEGAADKVDSPERKKWDQVREDIQRKARERKALQIGAIDEAHERELKRQLGLAVDLSLLSPGSAYARLIADICGTGELERSKYLEAVRSYQKVLDNEIFSKIKRTLMMHTGGKMSMGFSAEPIETSKLPKFTIAGTTLGDVFRTNLKSLFSLLFWLIAPFVFAYSRFIKYDVR